MKKLMIALLAALILALAAGCSAPENDPAPPADANIEDIAVAMVTDMSNGDFAAASDNYAYTGKMRQAVSETFLKKQIWEYLEKNYGAFQGLGDHSTTQTGAYETVSVVASFETADINVNVTFDADKLIAGLHCIPIE
jgi:hypothetical protein